MFSISLIKQKSEKRIINILGIFLIFVLALGLRLYGLDWDNGYLFHPDERQLLMLSLDMHFPNWSEIFYIINPEISPLNPRWFNYGSLPLYILEITTTFLSTITDLDLYSLRFPGRIISALFDSSTVTLISILAFKYFGKKVGFLTGLFSVFSVIQIQHAHFFVVDTILTFLIVGLIFLCVKISKNCTLKSSIICGILLAAALATKISSLPIIILIFLSYGLYALSPNTDYISRNISLNPHNIKKAFIGITACISISVIFFILFSPYAIIDFPKFIQDNLNQSRMVRGTSDLPYTRQYIDTIPYIYHLKQIITRSLGPTVSILSFLGLIFTLRKSHLPLPKIHIILIFWILFYFLIFGQFQVKFSRYMLPIIPFLLVYASLSLVAFYYWLNKKLPRLATPIISLLLLIALHYPISFLNIYSEDHTAVQASQFLNANATKNSSILKEHWDEGLPNLNNFKITELPLYNFDSTDKISNISSLLSKTDYIIIFSNRLYGTIPRLSQRYPLTSNYYARLFDGSLGFNLIHLEKKEPQFLGIKYINNNFARIPINPPKQLSEKSGFELFSLDLGWSDESFSVYDHPTILIFQNSKKMSSEEIFSLITKTVTPSEFLMNSEEEKTQYSGPDRNQIIFSKNLDQTSMIIIWYFFIQLLSISVIPIVLYSFNSLSDRGYILTKPIGLLINGLLVWLLTSLNFLSFSRLPIYLCLISVMFFSFFILIKQRETLISFIKSKWKLILTFELLFLISFIFFLIIRALNPDLWHPFRGGEKPMDFAYLNAIIRSTKMPPFDPWLSSGYLNYYYYGHYLIAYLIKATGLEPSIAYNLTIPLLFGFSVVTLTSLIWNIKPYSKTIFGKTNPLFISFISGFTILTVLLIGNLESLLQIISKIKETVSQRVPFGSFNYWSASRMMPSNSEGHEITEFPFFTFLFADLHAHLIVIPFMLVSLSTFLAIINHKQNSPKFSLFSLYIISSIIIGSIWAINTWDIPTQIILLSGIILFSDLKNHSDSVLKTGLKSILKIILILSFSFIIFFPFHSNFVAPNIGLELSKYQSPIQNFLAIFSIPIFIIIWIFCAISIFPGEPRNLVPKKTLLILVGILSFLSIATLMILSKYITLLFILFLIIFWIYSLKYLILKYKNSPLNFMFFFWYLGLIGLLILGGVELITLREDIGRMNTVFKFYIQAWILINISCSFFLGKILSFEAVAIDQKIIKICFTTTLLVLTISCFSYTILGTKARINDRFSSTTPTLDGTIFMEESTYKDPLGDITLKYDLLAIEWLNLNLKGSPIISEANTPLYRWGSRISVYTGLPTIIGWDWHQTQQRNKYKEQIKIRKNDLNLIYSTPDLKISLDLLKKYHAQYIYVGKLEKLYYPQEGINKFNSLNSIYKNQEVTIFEIPEFIVE